MHHAEENAAEVLSQILKQQITEQSVILCVGTDRCIGDALGPLVGTMLMERNFRFPVYGTLDEPVHAINLLKSVKEVQASHPNSFIIAVDACLGDENLIGNIHIKQGPIFPGKGVGKKLPGIGDLSVVGIVDKINQDDCLAIHNIRLSLIRNMAQVIADAFMLATYLS
ncbi:spore protease YyaC [Clostridiaceae bacterium 35-E11]